MKRTQTSEFKKMNNNNQKISIRTHTYERNKKRTLKKSLKKKQHTHTVSHRNTKKKWKYKRNSKYLAISPHPIRIDTNTYEEYSLRQVFILSLFSSVCSIYLLYSQSRLFCPFIDSFAIFFSLICHSAFALDFLGCGSGGGGVLFIYSISFVPAIQLDQHDSDKSA